MFLCFKVRRQQQMEQLLQQNRKSQERFDLLQQEQRPRLDEQRENKTKNCFCKLGSWNGRTDLKIFLNGLLLDCLDDPKINDLSGRESSFACLADEKPSRLADEILCHKIFYSVIEPSRSRPTTGRASDGPATASSDHSRCQAGRRFHQKTCWVSFVYPQAVN